MITWNKPNDLTRDEAINMANKCLSCKNPLCESGCPISMRIRDFIAEIKNNNLAKAREIIDSISPLSNICSVVCDHEAQCMGHCVRNKMKTPDPVNCGALEKYVQNNTEGKASITDTLKGVKVLVVGSGPAGIAASIYLLKMGALVDMVEKESYLGGVATYGIPSYRLDYKDILAKEEELKELGCNIKYNTFLKESDILSLKDKYDYIFISTGLTKVKKLGIPNDDNPNCLSALEFLKNVNEDVKINKVNPKRLDGKVLVVGAGNVAMDAARTAKRLTDKEVIIVYRRSIEEAPASKKEIEDAKAEGIIFKFLTNPVEVYVKDDKLTGLKCEVMKLSELDSSGRRKPVGTGEFIDIECDYVISAIGQNPDKELYDKNEIETDYGYIKADSNFKTNIDNIYVGGDITLGAKTVVEAEKTAKDFVNAILNKEQK